MKRGAATAVAVVALALLGWRAARKSVPPPPISPRLQTLREVLASKNDNDSRLDLAFDELTPGEKSEFRDEYRRLPREARNERGTVVYLLGKNLTTADDWAFMKEVAAEPPCLSLAACDKTGERPIDEAAGEEVTLAYPALVALKQAEAALTKPALPPGEAAAALAVIEAGAASKAPAAARLAIRLKRRFAVSARRP